MKDRCNREIKHIRFSVTSECNFNCLYCDQEGLETVPKSNYLTVEEITKICYLLAKILHVTRIKFTGGEPLCREDIVKIIQNVKSLNLYEDISMTTNGYYLYKIAEDLSKAGLDRVNVSLSSLNPKTFKKITGRNNLSDILRGLNKSQEVGLNPIKLNFVVLKGLNDNELEDMIEFSSETGYILQLIELHKSSDQVGKNKDFYEKYYYNLNDFIKELEQRSIKTQIRGMMQNRKVFTLENGAVIETIHPGHDFCMGCTKLRVGCDGNLFGCLFRSDLGRNLKEKLSIDAPLSKYEEIVKQVVNSREPHY
ncbi:MAG: GTP 3',8-cyclase MoaA [Candidatus Lokiarchaeota archaeon]